MFCTSCAWIGRPINRGRSCGHCGAGVDRARGRLLDAPGDQARYAALLAHPLYAQAMALPPGSVGDAQRWIGGLMIAAGLIAAVAALHNALTSWLPIGAVDFVILGMVGMWCAIGVAIMVNGRRHRTSPVLAVPVTATSVAPGASSDLLTVTVELARGGKRRELTASRDLQDVLVGGREGVAFVESGRLVGFADLSG